MPEKFMKEHTFTGHSRENHRSGSLVSMVFIAAMAAVICVLAPCSLAIPFSPVPISLTNLALYVIVYVEGWKRGLLSYLVYLLVGLAGMPVFSGFTSGPAKLLGPTGGYLIGMILLVVVAGIVVEHTSRWYLHFLGMTAGTAIAYLLGTAWLYASGLYPTFSSALAAGVVPFIPGDVIKMILACIAGPMLHKRLRKAGF